MRGGRYESMDGGACRPALDVLELAQRSRPLSLTNVNQIKVRRLWSVKTCDISCGVSKRVGKMGDVSCLFVSLRVVHGCLLVSAVELSKPTALLVCENAPSGVDHVSIGESSSRGWLVRGALGGQNPHTSTHVRSMWHLPPASMRAMSFVCAGARWVMDAPHLLTKTPFPSSCGRLGCDVIWLRLVLTCLGRQGSRSL